MALTAFASRVSTALIWTKRVGAIASNAGLRLSGRFDVNNPTRVAPLQEA